MTVQQADELIAAVTRLAVATEKVLQILTARVTIYNRNGVTHVEVEQ